MGPRFGVWERAAGRGFGFGLQEPLWVQGRDLGLFGAGIWGCSVPPRRLPRCPNKGALLALWGRPGAATPGAQWGGANNNVCARPTAPLWVSSAYGAALTYGVSSAYGAALHLWGQQRLWGCQRLWGQRGLWGWQPLWGLPALIGLAIVMGPAVTGLPCLWGCLCSWGQRCLWGCLHLWGQRCLWGCMHL